jgi:hypothetical protein
MGCFNEEQSGRKKKKMVQVGEFYSLVLLTPCHRIEKMPQGNKRAHSSDVLNHMDAKDIIHYLYTRITTILIQNAMLVDMTSNINNTSV